MSLRTSEPTRWGHGWISGVLGVLLAAASLGAVLCFHFPGLLTAPELRALYPHLPVRAVLQAALLLAFLLGTLSVCLRANKALGLTALCGVLVATLLGGAGVEAGEMGRTPALGLDAFLISLLLYSLVYVPLERAFPLRAEQPIFRAEWRTDLTYFAVSALLIQLTSFVILEPAATIFAGLRALALGQAVASGPLPVQVVAAVLVADLTQYWVHRAFHVVPSLWRFHAIHHSATTMDWLAGSRLHLVDALATRALTYAAIYAAGFSLAAIAIYVGLVVVQATFIHANVRWRMGWVARWIATPAFHHWHHSAETAAIDKNFAVHTPLWDRLFGTFYLPERWPHGYGIAGGAPVPAGFWRQFVWPFRAQRA